MLLTITGFFITRERFKFLDFPHIKKPVPELVIMVTQIKQGGGREKINTLLLPLISQVSVRKKIYLGQGISQLAGFLFLK
ncbi:MAG: hypothetical protein A2896_01945 [Candidatus Nealsonbacteria bacterium RIFCSPLOWO2_01_FULL_43_32]|uniref:Uncharacterized protein n=1 Tax=Candidatus Nealsonbacteria bacterium RIFCSPLOWO2_01_FULL_43_32 TaxID=1801672 RepID=A0A1G2EFX2_9BACT|nr:MAG: hypothetical protein A2896_01945 [Candidatus Nealsonbacteria bacterium RIFCSPLOWO2_01_FULL_43_32]